MRALLGIALWIALLGSIPYYVFAHESNEGDEVVVHIDPTGYTPANLTIASNTTVVFENTSTTELWPASNIHPTHEIYSEFDPQKPIRAGESWRFLFTRPGIWTYHDHLYPNITGTITVTADTYAWTPSSWLRHIVESFSDTFRPRITSTYSFDAKISSDADSVYTDPNALYSYIRVFGLPQTMQHLQALSAHKGSCHDPAHRAGRIAYELYDDKAFTTCSAECHSGCYHGATELFFRNHGTENLAANLTTLCSSELNSFISHQCLHGIGHGLMAWTNYEIHQALHDCDLLPNGRDSCYTGVFMENIVGSLEENSNGHHTNYLNEDPHYPCNVVEEKYAAACYFYQSSRMLQLFGQDWPRLAATCQSVPSRFHQHCFESLGRDIGGVFATDVIGAIKACEAVDARANRISCLNGAVQNYFWEPSGQEAALKFCAALPAPPEKEACYTTIANRASLVLPTTTDKARFCYHVETPWQRQCVAIVYP